MFKKSRPLEKQTINFNLSQIPTGVECTYHAFMQTFPIKRHTKSTRKLAIEGNSFLRHVPEERITHFIKDIELPSDAVCLTWVTFPDTVLGKHVDRITHMAIHTSRKGRKARAKRELRKPRNERLWDVHPRLKYYKPDYKVSASMADTEDGFEPQYPDGMETWQDAIDASIALMYNHSSLLNLNSEEDGAVPNQIIDIITAAISIDYLLPDAIDDEGENWSSMEETKDSEGNIILDDDGNIVYSMNLHYKVKKAMTTPLQAALKAVSEGEELEGQTWTEVYGSTSDTYEGSSTEQPKANSDFKTNMKRTHSPKVLRSEKKQTSFASTTSSDGYNWALKNKTPGSGISIDSDLKWVPTPASNYWNGEGSWSDLDEDTPLNQADIDLILEGKCYLKVNTTSEILTGQLRINGAVEDGEPIKLTTVLSGSATASGSGTFTLNGTQNGMSYKISGQNLGDSATAILEIEDTSVVRLLRLNNQSEFQGNIEFSIKNHWLRHLSAYTQYFTADNSVFRPKIWSTRLPEHLHNTFESNKNKKYLDYVPPINTIFGIPLAAHPCNLSIPIADGANGVRVLLGGLGTGKYDEDVCAFGIGLTVTLEYALPMALLAYGAANVNSKSLNNLLKDKEVMFAIVAASAFLVGPGSGALIATSQNPKRVIESMMAKAIPLFFKIGCAALGNWIEKQLAVGLAAKAVPFMNAVVFAINAAATAAQLAQTTSAVLQSPFVFNLEVSRSIDIAFTITPEKQSGVFPDLATEYLVSVVYDSSATNPRRTFQLPGGRISNDLDIFFKNAPAGGKLRVYVIFYADNGWPAGQGSSDWVEAKGNDGSTLRIDDINILTNEVPLTKDSVYNYKTKIAYNQREGHYWTTSGNDVPITTRNMPSPFGSDCELTDLISITMAQESAMMGYHYSARGLPGADAQTAYTIQNLSTLEEPESKYATVNPPFSSKSGILYDMAGPADGTGMNFFIDPTRGSFDEENNLAGGFHLRKIRLDKNSSEPPKFNVGNDQSWGRFPVKVDQMILHPQGYIIAYSNNPDKILILEIPKSYSSDEEAPMATMASGEGFRSGLIHGPKGLATGLDGRVLILESNNHRIQAFDVLGKPVPYFAVEGDPDGLTSILNLKHQEGTSYLDLAVEAKGYLYVLRYTGDGNESKEYMVDLYEPDGNFLVTTVGVAAAKLTVSLLRNMFTLNYETIQGPENRAEPSVSLWIPPAPNPNSLDH